MDAAEEDLDTRQETPAEILEKVVEAGRKEVSGLHLPCGS